MVSWRCSYANTNDTITIFSIQMQMSMHKISSPHDHCRFYHNLLLERLRICIWIENSVIVSFVLVYELRKLTSVLFFPLTLKCACFLTYYLDITSVKRRQQNDTINDDDFIYALDPHPNQSSLNERGNPEPTSDAVSLKSQYWVPFTKYELPMRWERKISKVNDQPHVCTNCYPKRVFI